MGYKDEKWAEAPGYCVECDNLRPLDKAAVCRECYEDSPLYDYACWVEDAQNSSWYYARLAAQDDAHGAPELRISPTQPAVVAGALDEAVKKYGDDILGVTLDTLGLPPAAVAQVRFFTANQDFREPPSRQFEMYLEDPTQFDAEQVAADPEGFLRFLKMTRLSQTDKRADYARKAARFLLDLGVPAIGVAERHGNDAVEVRSALVGTRNMGYGLKKANMFIRDMFELGVWPDLSHFSEVDVASDINTMKVALRAGLMESDIPLLSSFLDVFCHQYGHVDSQSAAAWRAVWQAWNSLPDGDAPSSPCQMDFLLYRIGKDYCKDIVVRYECERGHEFLHFSASPKKCLVCPRADRAPAHVTDRLLPCQVDAQHLPREDGILRLPDDNLLHRFDGRCILEPACRPKDPGFRPLDPPKSISIKGQTAWTNSYSDRDRGGGGMMA